MRHPACTTSAILFALITLLFVGCGPGPVTEAGLSDQVAHLWATYPAPWDKITAQKAADEALHLLENHPDDLQLKLYWQDRMMTADPAFARRQARRQYNADPNDPLLTLLHVRINIGGNKAADLLTDAAENAPDNPYVQAYAAIANADAGPMRIKPADRYSKRALRLGPNLPETHYARAKFLLSRNEPAKAEGHALAAHETNPAAFDYVALLAACYERQRKLKESIDLLEGYQEAHPCHPALVQALAARYKAMGRTDAMLRLQYNRAVGMPEDGWAWYDLARLLAAENRPDSALTALETAVDHGFYDYHILSIEMKQENNPFHLFWRYIKTAQNLQKGMPPAEAVDDQQPPVDPRRAAPVAATFAEVQKRMLEEQRASRGQRREVTLADTINRKAPEFTFETLDGDTLSLADMRGKAVVLHFRSHHSPQNDFMLPRLRGFYVTKATPGRDSRLVTLNIDLPATMETKRRLRLDLSGKAIMWPVLVANREIAEAYDVLDTPSFVVIDPEGYIRYRIDGYQTFLDETLGWMVTSLLQAR